MAGQCIETPLPSIT